MQTFSFGTISQVMLFGGGANLELCLELFKGRGMRVTVVTSERQKSTLNPNIPHLVSDDVNTDEKVLNEITSETLGISCGAAWILKQPFIEHFGGKLVNLHGAALPKDRGAGGFSWRILRGERQGSALIHQVDMGIDTGAILMQEKFEFSPSCRTPQDFEAELLEHYRVLLPRFFEQIEKGGIFTLTVQEEKEATYWPRLATDKHGFIDWRWEAPTIERFICAFDEPYTGASSFLNDVRVHLKNCTLQKREGHFHPFQSGLVYRIDEGALYIAVPGGALVIKKVMDEQGRDITASVRLGDRFNTPQPYLDEALAYRAVYTPKGLR